MVGTPPIPQAESPDVPQDERKQRLGRLCPPILCIPGWIWELLGGMAGIAWSIRSMVGNPSKPRRTWAGQRRLIAAHRGHHTRPAPFRLRLASHLNAVPPALRFTAANLSFYFGTLLPGIEAIPGWRRSCHELPMRKDCGQRQDPETTPAREERSASGKR